MRILYNFGAVVSVFFLLMGMFFLWRVAHFSSDVGYCITAFVAASTLSLMLNMFRLRGRIDALEKRAQQEKQECFRGNV